MATVKKHVELLEVKIDDLEKTLSHQKEIMNMMKDTMMNQKMILEMIVSKLNNNGNSVQTGTAPQIATVVESEPTVESSKPKAKSDVFPMNRRVMV